MANEEQLRLLQQGVKAWNKNCKWAEDNPLAADLSGADLSGADLTRAYLRGANLSGADLTRAKLTGAALRGASLLGARLREADLSGAFLREAKLTGADLTRAKLTGADLTGADLSEANQANVSKTILERAHPSVRSMKHLRSHWLITNLTDANLSGAKLTQADLSGADLTRAYLGQANLSGAFLRKAKLTGAHLLGADLTRAKLTKATFYNADLSEAKLIQADLSGADLTRANLRGANLSGADLSGANFYMATLTQADLSGADLQEAKLIQANLWEATLTGADLQEAHLMNALLQQADLQGANLTNAKLIGATLVNTNLRCANLTGASIFGISAWKVDLTEAVQTNLIISDWDEPAVTVDDLEVAQFIYLLLNRQKLRNVIDTITSKGVLILGRFTPERKVVLDAMADEVRKYNLLPIIFDFDRSTNRDFTETIKILAGLSLFVIVDITNPKSAPLELQATVPDYQIPFVPIIQHGEEPFSMFRDLPKYDWLLKPVVTYPSIEKLLQHFKPAVIDRAIEKHKEIQKQKLEQIDMLSIESFTSQNES